ncbi:MAG: retropepsin-like aspartic protease [Wenzhouxiangellaceae bacterium]|nr:retropepsin-like aspartic protease [Wenzhouxiangellaceae bacterium]
MFKSIQVSGARAGRAAHAKAFSVLMAAAAALAATTVPAQQADEAGWMPFAAGQDRPAIEVAINGQSTIAIFDTGFSANAISAEFARQAGIGTTEESVRLVDAGGGEALPIAETFKMELAGTPIDMERVVVMSAPGVGIVIGRPLLEMMVVQIDYPGRKLRVMPTDSADFEGNLKTRRGRFDQLMVQARINGKRVWMSLDTSNDGLCLVHRRSVAKHDWAQSPISIENAEKTGVTVRSDLQPLHLGSLDIGGYQLGGFVAAYAHDEIDERHYGASRITEKFGGDGILGFEVMRNFMLTMNLAEDKVHIYAP